MIAVSSGVPSVHQSISLCAQSATSGTKVRDADSLIFATPHGFITNHIVFVIQRGGITVPKNTPIAVIEKINRYCLG
jgi:hypothetical protein